MQKIENTGKTQLIARLIGTMLAALCVLKWIIIINKGSFPIGGTKLFSASVIILCDVTIIIGTCVGWKNTLSAGKIIFFAAVFHEFWSYANLPKRTDILSYVYIFVGIFTAGVFLYSYSKSISEDRRRLVIADICRWLARAGGIGTILVEVYRFTRLFLSNIDLDEFTIIFHLLEICWMIGIVIAWRNELGGAALVFIFSLLSTLSVYTLFYEPNSSIGYWSAIYYEIPLLLCAVLFAVSSFLHDPKPEPLPEIEE